MAINEEIFKSRLKIARQNKKLTQEGLAKAIGLSYNSILNYEQKGKGLPSLDVLVKIADTLEISIDWLLGRESIDEQ